MFARARVCRAAVDRIHREGLRRGLSQGEGDPTNAWARLTPRAERTDSATAARVRAMFLTEEMRAAHVAQREDFHRHRLVFRRLVATRALLAEERWEEGTETFDAYFHCCKLLKLHRYAQELFAEMERRDVPRSVRIVSLVMYIAAGAGDDPRRFLPEFERLNEHPGALAQKAVLRYFARTSDEPAALDFVRRLGRHARTTTLVHLIPCCKTFRSALRQFRRLPEARQRSPLCLAMLMQVCLKSDDAANAASVLAMLEACGGAETADYNQLMMLHLRRGDAGAVYATLERMAGAGCRADVYTYVHCFSAYALDAPGDVQAVLEAEALFEGALNDGFRFVTKVYGGLLEVYAAVGDVAKAERLKKRLAQEKLKLTSVMEATYARCVEAAAAAAKAPKQGGDSRTPGRTHKTIASGVGASLPSVTPRRRVSVQVASTGGIAAVSCRVQRVVHLHPTGTPPPISHGGRSFEGPSDGTTATLCTAKKREEEEATALPAVSRTPRDTPCRDDRLFAGAAAAAAPGASSSSSSSAVEGKGRSSTGGGAEGGRRVGPETAPSPGAQGLPGDVYETLLLAGARTHTAQLAAQLEAMRAARRGENLKPAQYTKETARHIRHPLRHADEELARNARDARTLRKEIQKLERKQKKRDKRSAARALRREREAAAAATTTASPSVHSETQTTDARVVSTSVCTAEAASVCVSDKLEEGMRVGARGSSADADAGADILAHGSEKVVPVEDEGKKDGAQVQVHSPSAHAVLLAAHAARSGTRATHTPPRSSFTVISTVAAGTRRAFADGPPRAPTAGRQQQATASSMEWYTQAAALGRARHNRRVVRVTASSA